MTEDENIRAYDEAIRRGEAAPQYRHKKPISQADITREYLFEPETNRAKVIQFESAKGVKVSVLIKQMIEITKEYCAKVKPRGLEDLCWYEINQQHPIGELANTYEVHEDRRVVELGPQFPTFAVDQDGNTISVSQPSTFVLYIYYVKDLNT